MADKILSFLDSLINAVKTKQQYDKAEFYKVDGTIIGNGSQDFTKTYKTYSFTINGVSAQLIDIPGIEGKESFFIDIIKDALKKAHLVCYVAREAKGIEANTLEKIQSYLGKNVEVLGIHNIPLSPQKLYEGDDYVGDMRKKVVAGLEKKSNIEEALRQKISDELYVGTVGCAVLPALCGLCMHDGNSTFANPEDYDEEVKSSLITLHRQQKNFLLRATNRDLLQISNISSLQKAIANSCVNAPNRILKNAFCRLQNILNEGYFASIQEQQKAWKSYRMKAERSADALISSLDDSKKRLQKNLSSAAKSAVTDFYNDEVLEKIFYPSIEENHKIVKDDLEYRFKKAKNSLDASFKKRINNVISATCNDYFDRVKAYANDFVHSMTLQLDNLKAEMPSMDNTSFDWGGLGSFAFGIASMAASGAAIGTFFCPGLGTAIGAGIGALVGAAKEWFMSVFRKEKHILNLKKKAQDNVDEMVEKTWKELKVSLDRLVPSVTKTGTDISNKASKIKEDAKIIETLLSELSKEVKKISKNIDKEIKKLEVNNVA